MNADDAKRRLATMIGKPSQRQQITEPEWWEIAAIVARKHRRPGPPQLDDRDHERYCVQLAQHHVAWDVLEWKKFYRWKNNCKNIKAAKTAAALDEAKQREARRFNVALDQLSDDAIRTIIKNNRPLIRYPMRPSFRNWHTN
jgi:hypothetical protein